MVNKIRKLKREFEQADNKYQKELIEMKANVNEVKVHSEKLSKDITSVNIIISDIDKQFAEKTGITNPKDMTFLWGAVALQCGRWILIPALDEDVLTPDTSDRKGSGKEGKKDKTKSGKQLDKDRESREQQRYINSIQIMDMPVAYDAMMGTEDIVIPGVTELGKNLCGSNHHSATFGHDPILGYFFGTCNIITRSISFRDMFMTTRRVHNPSGRVQVVSKDNYGIPMMMQDVVQSIMEEKTRLVAGLLKQVLHLQSDKYTKNGLPIPLIPPGMQQHLLNQKWNSKELERLLANAAEGIVKQLTMSVLINESIGTLHGFCYNEFKDESKELYSVRTRKIIATSNVIADGINIAVVAGGAVVGALTEDAELIKKSICHLDVGGYIEAIHQVANSKKLQEEIRREFLEQELFNHFNDNKFSFLEEEYYG